jgi:2-oxoglutarate dehydrogenase E2 component (dihydrolipoamide succinyltransferase)
MPTEVKIPEVGESITEVQISDWLKAEGDTVKKDEPMAVIDSEKTTFELPAPQTGRLSKILRKAGDTVGVGQVIAHIESNGEGGSKSKPAEKKPSQPKKSPPQEEKPKGDAQNKAPVKSSAGTQSPEEKKSEVQTTPKAAGWDTPEKETKAAAASKKTEKPAEKTEEPVASEPDEKPVEKTRSSSGDSPAPSKTSDAREEEVVPMTMLRRTVARRLVEAKQQMAMLTTFNEVDMSAVQTLRREHQEAFEKRYQVRLGFMSFFVKAAIDALKQFPQLNAEIRSNDIVYRNYFDIGVAIASERGLVVPVLRGAERLSFAEVEKTIGDFAKRAGGGKLKLEELEGGTFTITNGGVFGSLLSTPINPPQTGILGMHTIQERPIALNGQVVIRPMMYLALTYDHRIVDGREAVLFLRRVKETIENPARMLIEV